MPIGFDGAIQELGCLSTAADARGGAIRPFSMPRSSARRTSKKSPVSSNLLSGTYTTLSSLKAKHRRFKGGGADEESKEAPPENMRMSPSHWDRGADDPPPVPTFTARRRPSQNSGVLEAAFGSWLCCAEEEPMTLPDIPQGPLWGPLVRHMPCRDDADVHARRPASKIPRSFAPRAVPRAQVFLQLLDGLVGRGNVANDVCESGNSILHYCAQRSDPKLLLALSDLPNTNLDHERYVDLLRKKNFGGQRPLDLALMVDAADCVAIIQTKHRLMGFNPDAANGPAAAAAPPASRRA